MKFWVTEFNINKKRTDNLTVIHSRQDVSEVPENLGGVTNSTSRSLGEQIYKMCK
jgi:hypothetical protein